MSKDEPATKTDIQHLDKRLDGVDRRLDSMDIRFDGIDKRFEGIDTRLDGMDKRMDGMSAEVRRLGVIMEDFAAKHDSLMEVVMSMNSRMDSLATKDDLAEVKTEIHLLKPGDARHQPRRPGPRAAHHPA